MTVHHYKELRRWNASAFCANCHIWLQEYKQVSYLCTLFPGCCILGM